VQDGRKRVIEMMQQFLPLLVLRRFAKPLFVSRDAIPTHEKEIVAFAFEAPLEFV